MGQVTDQRSGPRQRLGQPNGCLQVYQYTVPQHVHIKFNAAILELDQYIYTSQDRDTTIGVEGGGGLGRSNVYSRLTFHRGFDLTLLTCVTSKRYHFGLGVLMCNVIA